MVPCNYLDSPRAKETWRTLDASAIFPQMAEASFFLDDVNKCAGVRADFVGRVAGVPVSTDKGSRRCRLRDQKQEMRRQGI